MSTLTKRQLAPLYRVDLECARDHFSEACKLSREWNALHDDALSRYGDKGSHISGAGRDHFPNDVKDELRRLARLVTQYADAGHAARPKGVRRSTMNHLARLIATRDGGGFYGPRPYYGETI